LKIRGSRTHVSTEDPDEWASEEDEDEDACLHGGTGKQRPASFTQKKTTSQGKSKAKVDTKSYDKVIEVSSDSDSDDSLPSRIALPPLMVARARTTTKSIQATTTLSRPGKKAVGNSLTHTTESEVIDLT